MFKKHAPPVSPEYDTPWRSINWDKDRQNLLKAISEFKPETPKDDTLRVLLYGPVGAGKSSFFNSVDNVLQGRISTRALAHSERTDESFTVECRSYKVKKVMPGSYFPFTFTDMAGIQNERSIQTEDIIKVLKGHICDGYIFNPVKPIDEDDPKYRRNPTLKDRIHCLVAVLPAKTVSMMDEKYFEQMKKVRRNARDLGIPQVIIMTKVDEACPLVKVNLKKIYTSKKIKQKMEECSNKLGVPLNCIFPVKNYHDERTINATTDLLILDALKNIIYFANDYVEDQAEAKKEPLKSI